MKILITGCNGLLGSNLVQYFTLQGFNVTGTSLSDKNKNKVGNFIYGDLIDESFVKELIINVEPDIVINTVALVNIDLCEEEKEMSHNINVKTALNISKELNQNIQLIHISTDHLFSGIKSFYTELDTPKPINQYGLTKLLAEKKCLSLHKNTLVIRTNIFGWSPLGHHNTFAEWIYYSLKSDKKINLYNDYFFSPIEVILFAKIIAEIIPFNLTGVYNICGSERCSKYQFGISLAKAFSLNESLIYESKIDSSSFRIKRPKDLSLSVKKIEKIALRSLPNIESSIQSFLSLSKNKMLI